MPIPIQKDNLKKMSLKDMARHRIREAILDGTLQPGERLNDETLSSWLGVSRTPIREALTELSATGLIEASTNRITRVASIDSERTRDSIIALGILASGIYGQILKAVSDSTREALATDLEKRLDKIKAGEIERLAFESPALYAQWLSLCPNAALVTAAQGVIDGLAFQLRSEIVPKLFGTPATLHELANLIVSTRENDRHQAEGAIRKLHFVD